MTLSGVSSNAELGSGATAKGTIRDDDDPPAVSFGAASYAVDEGGSVERPECWTYNADGSCPLPVEQLVRTVHAPLGGSCLPLDQLIGLLLRCGDLAENLPDLLRGRGFVLSVDFGHGYAR